MVKKRLFLAVCASMLLTACGGGSGNTEGGNTCPVVGACTKEEDPPLPTPITDGFAFPYESTYKNVDFEEVETGVVAGQAKLTLVTDGDTATFTTVNGHSIKCRFLGINTPESTAHVEPWGVRASHFAKKVLLEATDWCLVNDIDTFEKRDNTSSQRSLAFVWYKTKEGQWRFYNLECVEQGYSQRTLFKQSKLTGYLEAFTQADDRGKACGYRVYGKNNDCTYDYTKSVSEVTLYQVRNRYDELGITDESSGKQLRITALVVGLIGDNLVLRDVVKDLEQEDDEPYTCLYAYAGYSGSLASWVGVGDIVNFYCRATKFSDNIQLSDLKTSTTGSQKFRVLVDAALDPEDPDYDPDYVPDYGEYAHDLDPIPVEIEGETASLDPVSGQFVETDIEIREIQNGERDEDGNVINVDPDNPTKYYTQSNKSPYSVTIYGRVKGTKTICNLRIDGGSFPKKQPEFFSPGKGYHIKGYLTPYYNNYQIQLFNDYNGYNYVVEL